MATMYNSKRQSRKLEHIRYSIEASKQDRTLFEDMHLVHNCLPELDINDVSFETELAGIPLQSPIIINAITGGSKDVSRINLDLAKISREFKLAMAVGSQTAALEDSGVAYTFELVREANPEGILFANIGAHVTPEQALRAIEMISADALQIHLNVAQELVMPEGDRRFTGYLANISEIVRAAKVPVIIKEVGFGVAKGQVRELVDAGVTAIDVGGVGGTNFAIIESMRYLQHNNETVLKDWGIPTAISLVEVLSELKKYPNVNVMATGGIRSASHIAKALALGACAVGVAGLFLETLIREGKQSLQQLIRTLHCELKQQMLLTGSRTLTEFSQKPVVVMGACAEWLVRRGIDINAFAQRDSLFKEVP